MGLTRLAAGVVLATVTAGAGAQNFPVKPVHMYIGFLPGTSTDLLARMLGQKMTEAWGQQVVVDNRSGGNGVIAAQLAAQSNADGHTLLMVAIGHAINPSLQKSLPYNSERDFVPISLTAVLPLMVKPELEPLMEKLRDELVQAGISTRTDDSGAAIGKKYARVDELGVPFCITLDFVGDGAVTLRDRDTTEQVRIPIDSLVSELLQRTFGR